MGRQYTVSIEITVDDEDGDMTPRQVAEEGWSQILALRAPVVSILEEVPASARPQQRFVDYDFQSDEEVTW